MEEEDWLTLLERYAYMPCLSRVVPKLAIMEEMFATIARDTPVGPCVLAAAAAFSCGSKACGKNDSSK